MSLTATDVLSAADADRLWSKVDRRGGPMPIDPYRPVDGPCWLWTTGTFPAGYGSFSVQNRSYLAHRLVYELEIGPIPPGYEIDHVCRVRACVNPAHLEAVTPAENMRRTQKPRCINGHAYTPENTLSVKGKSNQRLCKICSQDKDRRYKAKRKLEALSC